MSTINQIKTGDKILTNSELDGRLRLLTKNFRLNHLEADAKKQIMQIAHYYHSVFNLPGDPHSHAPT